MFKRAIPLLVMMMILICPWPLQGAPPDAASPIIEGELLDMGAVEEVVNQLDQEIKQAIPQLDFRTLVHTFAKGESDWSIDGIFKGLIEFIFSEVLANMSLLGKLVVLAVITAVLQNLMTAFEKATTGKLAYFICYLVLMTLAVGSFGLAINIGREAVDNMVGFMQALLPLLLTLLTALGGITAATIFHPVILGSITVIGTVIKNIVLPLIFFGAVLSILNGISAQFNVSKMADLFKTVSMVALGLCSTVFLGVLAVQGIASSVSDGVALRTAKFTTDAFVPVVGSTIADAMEAVLGSALLMKNAVGIAGVVIIIIITALPLLKILAIALVYRLAGALVQPVGDNQIANCLTLLSNHLFFVFGAVATTGLMFFFAIAIVVGMGNLTVMLR